MIREKVETELQSVKALCEIVENAIRNEFEKGTGNVDTQEMYKVVDIYKDLSEVKKNIIEGCYKMQIMEAMEESEYGKDYDENGEIRYYRNQPRDKDTGRYVKAYTMTPEMYNDKSAAYYRDMDRAAGKMYYTESRDYREGRSGKGRKMYMETKAIHNSDNPNDKQAKLRELENYMSDLSGDVTEMIMDASPEEKAMLKTKMQTLIQKIG